MKPKKCLYLVLFVLSCIILGPVMIVGALNIAVLLIGTVIYLNFGPQVGKGILDYLVVGPGGPAGSFSLMIYFFKVGIINFFLVYVPFYIMSVLKEAYDSSKADANKSDGSSR